MIKLNEREIMLLRELYATPTRARMNIDQLIEEYK